MGTSASYANRLATVLAIDQDASLLFRVQRLSSIHKHNMAFMTSRPAEDAPPGLAQIPGRAAGLYWSVTGLAAIALVSVARVSGRL